MLIDRNGNKLTPKKKAQELVAVVLNQWLFDIPWEEHGELKGASKTETNLVYLQLDKIVRKIIKNFR